MAAVSSYTIVRSRYVLVLGVPLGSGFVLCSRLFALGVGFGRSAFAAISYRIFGLRSVLVLDVPSGGGFALSFCWFALGVGFGRHPN